MDRVGGVVAILLMCMLFSATSLPLVSREAAGYEGEKNEDEKCSLCIVRVLALPAMSWKGILSNYVNDIQISLYLPLRSHKPPSHVVYGRISSVSSLLSICAVCTVSIANSIPPPELFYEPFHSK